MLEDRARSPGRRTGGKSMAEAPAGNIQFTSIASGVDTWPAAVPIPVPAGWDQASCQVVISDPAPGNVTVNLEWNAATAGLTPQPDFADVPDAEATAVATPGGTSTLGGTSGALNQLVQIGNAAQIRMTVASAGGVPAGTQVDMFLSSISSVGS